MRYSAIRGKMNWNLSTIVLRESFIASPSHHLELPSLNKWSESFSSLVASQYGVFLFRAFLKSEFSHENLDFWVAVQDFNNLSKSKEMVSKANSIYNNFIASQAPNQVNLDHEIRSTIQNRIELQNVHQGMFDRAQRRIQYMMEQDSYVRFRESDLLIKALDLLKISKTSK